MNQKLKSWMSDLAMVAIAIVFLVGLVAGVIGFIQIIKPYIQSQPAPTVQQSQTEITWLGWPVYAIPNPTPDTETPIVIQAGFRMQIGFRDDGIVIWRPLKEKPETEQVEEGSE